MACTPVKLNANPKGTQHQMTVILTGGSGKGFMEEMAFQLGFDG